jgi:hypothetical protein
MRAKAPVLMAALLVQGTLTTGCALVSGSQSHNAASAVVSVGAIVAGSIIASNPQTCGGSSCEFTGGGLIVLGTIGALVFIPWLIAHDDRTVDGRAWAAAAERCLREHPPVPSPRVCSSRMAWSAELAMGGVEARRNDR